MLRITLKSGYQAVELMLDELDSEALEEVNKAVELINDLGTRVHALPVNKEEAALEGKKTAAPEPATEKQKKFLRDLGVEFNEKSITKAEAYRLLRGSAG